jgi:hypothetical protein
VRLSAWIKADSLLSKAYLAIFTHTPTLSLSTPGTELYSETFAWTHATIETDVPKDALLIWAWINYNVPAPGTLWIDDARFEVIGDASPPAGSGKSRVGSAKPRRTPR